MTHFWNFLEILYICIYTGRAEKWHIFANFAELKMCHFLARQCKCSSWIKIEIRKMWSHLIFNFGEKFEWTTNGASRDYLLQFFNRTKNRTPGKYCTTLAQWGYLLRRFTVISFCALITLSWHSEYEQSMKKSAIFKYYLVPLNWNHWVEMINQIKVWL